MAKEHAGGFLPEGFADVPLEWNESEPQAVQVVQFDFSTLDNIEDCAREALAEGCFRQFIIALSKSLEEKNRRQAILQIVGFADKFATRGMGLDLMIDICGLGALEGKTGVDYARIWGVTKQDWQQQRERMREILEMPKNRTMRDDSARARMRLRNHRRYKLLPASGGGN